MSGPENEKLESFWDAITNGLGETAIAMLEEDSTLAGRNYRPDSLHTDGFPLYRAANRLDTDLVKALLNAGADPDAKLGVEEPRERGMPLLNAFHESNRRGLDNYDVVHLILDYNPSLVAFPYCSTPFVDCTFNNLWDTEADYQPGETWRYKRDCDAEVAKLFRKAFETYTAVKKADGEPVSSDDFPELNLLQRVIELGGQPSLFTLVRHEQHALIAELLQHHASDAGPVSNWPRGTVLDNVKGAATWCGYPKSVRACMELCPDLYTPDFARHSIENAITSHNRDGDIDQYFALIKSQLEFLKSKDALNEKYDRGDPFIPLHLVAEDFIQKSHYGFKCERLGTEADAIRLAKLFIEYGFDPDSKSPKTNKTVSETAAEHGLEQLAAFLAQQR
ncbi:ankyrin repeat domain-containing protein [Mariniblastus fucicola]|uniref:Ankyrin repeats (3 copies) n=1 Tax=Mariniblastus fucicola TaxID=980251 RepID=A0A5B9P8Q5_9BACT|nr:ankyrin repeat domain-containing protein [Mariniblastus fucicola]QEG21595.1 Ankyrin repeats (3 copies) [Mariniblastus fucicola]